MKSKIESDVVLAKATFVAAECLGLSEAELAQALGTDVSVIAVLKERPCIEPSTSMGRKALSLVRLSRALSALCGGNQDWVVYFMTSFNKLTGGIPLQQITAEEGLASTVRVVESLAGR